MWPGISQAPENVTCAALALGAGPLLCTHHPGEGVCTHTWGRGGGELPLQTTCFTLFPFSPLKKESPRLGISVTALRCTVSLQGLCASPSFPVHMCVNVYTSSQGEIFKSSVIYVCDLEKKCHVLVKKEGH